MGGQCTSAWKSCNTGFYSVCCSQPEGPKTLNAYCEKEDMEKKGEGDKACQVNGMMKGVNKDMGAISSTVVALDKGGGQDQFQLAGGKGQGAGGPSAAPNGWGAAPGAAPNGLVATTPAPAPAPPTLAQQCAHLQKVAQQAAAKMDEIKKWGMRNGMRGLDGDGDGRIDYAQEGKEDPEGKDPDLVFCVRNVLAIGMKLKRLLARNKFCGQHLSGNVKELLDDIDNDEKDADSDDDDDGESNDDGDDTEVNQTAVKELLEFDQEMKSASDKLETGVHPHGYKWWRYRYEYSILESIVFAWSVMLMYLLQWLFFGASYFRTHRFYKTGRPIRIYRYSGLYWVCHAAIVCVMVFVSYMLYMPWGDNNLFNLFAKAFHDFVDDAFHVPFKGYSWLFMVLDIQFQLFATFCLYALFTVMVVSNYIAALEDWKSIDDGNEAKKPINAMLFNRLGDVIRARTEYVPAGHENRLKQAFKDAQLRLPGVKELEDLPFGDDKGHFDFKLHLFLTDGLGKSVEYLVEISLVTHLWLCVIALLSALLAHHFQLAFMYFLAPFVIIGVLLLVLGFFISKHYLALSETKDHHEMSTYVTVHSYCRTIQIILYCVFYSFSRLLLSSDIWANYPHVYIRAFVGLVGVLILLALFGGEALKEATCALILIPHVSMAQFEKNLEEIRSWHTNVKCHESGVEQIPFRAAYSIAWAGRHNHIEGSPRSDKSSRRLWSFR